MVGLVVAGTPEPLPNQCLAKGSRPAATTSVAALADAGVASEVASEATGAALAVTEAVSAAADVVALAIKAAAVSVDDKVVTRADLRRRMLPVARVAGVVMEAAVVATTIEGMAMEEGEISAEAREAIGTPWADETVATMSVTATATATVTEIEIGTETEIESVTVTVTAIAMAGVAVDETRTTVLASDSTTMMGRTATRGKSEGIDLPRFRILVLLHNVVKV